MAFRTSSTQRALGQGGYRWVPNQKPKPDAAAGTSPHAQHLDWMRQGCTAELQVEKARCFLDETADTGKADLARDPADSQVAEAARREHTVLAEMNIDSTTPAGPNQKPQQQPSPKGWGTHKDFGGCCSVGCPDRSERGEFGCCLVKPSRAQSLSSHLKEPCQDPALSAHEATFPGKWRPLTYLPPTSSFHHASLGLPASIARGAAATPGGRTSHCMPRDLSAGPFWPLPGENNITVSNHAHSLGHS